MPQMGKSKFRGETTHSRHSLTCFQVKGDEPGFKCKPAECQATALMLQCTLKAWGRGWSWCAWALRDGWKKCCRQCWTGSRQSSPGPRETLGNELRAGEEWEGMIMGWPAGGRYPNFSQARSSKPRLSLLASLQVETHTTKEVAGTPCKRMAGSIAGNVLDALWVDGAHLSKEFFAEKVLSDLKGLTVPKDVSTQAVSLFGISAT